jgi:hypothetical protein
MKELTPEEIAKKFGKPKPIAPIPAPAAVGEEADRTDRTDGADKPKGDREACLLGPGEMLCTHHGGKWKHWAEVFPEGKKKEQKVAKVAEKKPPKKKAGADATWTPGTKTNPAKKKG